MNLLDFITNDDLNDIKNLKTMPVSFQMINLHTKDRAKAIRICEEFFYTRLQVGENYYYYTDGSDYQFYGGWEYGLRKSNNGIYWLVLKNTEKIEV